MKRMDQGLGVGEGAVQNGISSGPVLDLCATGLTTAGTSEGHHLYRIVLYESHLQCQQHELETWGLKYYTSVKRKDFSCGSAGKEPSCNAGDLVRSLSWEDPLEKGRAEYSGLRIPWTVQSMGSQRVEYD